jgi:hypothetical protein
MLSYSQQVGGHSPQPVRNSCQEMRETTRVNEVASDLAARLEYPHTRLSTAVTDGPRNAQLTGRHAHRSGVWLFWADQDCGLHSDFSWSHLWSHSCKFSGVRSGLPSLGSGATEPNRTCLNHQPQNSKAREVKASAGSNPAATAN